MVAPQGRRQAGAGRQRRSDRSSGAKPDTMPAVEVAADEHAQPLAGAAAGLLAISGARLGETVLSGATVRVSS